MLIASRWFWCALVFALTFTLILALYRSFFLEKGHTLHKIMLGLYALYLGILFVLILFPTYMLRPFRFSTSKVNLVPFNAIRRIQTDPKELIGNLLLFVPFGFFSVLNDRFKAKRRLINVLWRTALISAMMELLQMLIGRVTDIDDVILNTFSGLLGGALCVAWHKTRLDHTAVGEKLMPELPKRWRGKLAIPLLSLVMLICYGGGLFSANAIVTRYTGKEYSIQVRDQTKRFVLEAENAMLWDRTNQQMLFGNATDALIYPASTIKLAVCLTALDIAEPDDQITVGTELLRVPMDCSCAGIRMGTTYTVYELLAGALLPSGADACYALGTYCGRILLNDSSASDNDALSAFIHAANAKLQNLGATSTTILNVEGLDEEGQQTTAEDLCRIASAFMDDPVLSQLCATAEMTIGPENDRLLLKNTNQIIQKESEFYSENFTGIKTGSTSRAGNCLIGAFINDGMEYITIVMHSGYEGKFRDTLTLAQLVQES